MATHDPQRAVDIVPILKRAISNHAVLNEAFDYPKPSSFSRGMRIDLDGLVILLISGTASIDEHGATVHAGDFRAQCRRTFQNITALLAAEGASGKTLCAPAATSATSIATTPRSTRNARPSTPPRDSILSRPPPASRPNSAAPNCWSKSKPSPCSANCPGRSPRIASVFGHGFIRACTVRKPTLECLHLSRAHQTAKMCI